MKQFLASPAARRWAWTALWSLAVGLLAPFAEGRAQAQTPARTAYFVPLTAAAGVDAEIPQRTTNEIVTNLRKYRTDARVKNPIELLTLTKKNPVVKRAIDDHAITDDQIDNPPTDRDAAVKFARQLGLTTLLAGQVESYKEAPDKTNAKIEVTILEFNIPPQADAAPVVTRTVSKSTTVIATDDAQKALLRTAATQRIAMQVLASLLDAPDLAPPDKAPVTSAAAAKKGRSDAIWLLVGVAAVVGLIFAISTIGGNKNSAPSGLSVAGVQASSEQNSVRLTWTAASSAIGYNVYRRSAGSQTIRSRGRSRGRQTTGYELLLNPDTNTSPTVIGSSRTSFIDTTSQSGTIYDYAVAGVSSSGVIGGLSASASTTQSGPNIGSSPTLTATGGNGFIQLNWTASSSFVTGYIIFRRQGGTPDTSKNSPDQLAQVGLVTAYNDGTAKNDSTYTYIVQPETTVNTNNLLAGQDSNAATVTPTASSAPQAPQSVTSSADNTGRVTISWNANPEKNISFYEILQRRDKSRSRAVATGQAPWLRGMTGPTVNRVASPRHDPRQTRQLDLTGFQIIGTSDASVTKFTQGPLADGTYTFAVRAVNSLGQRGPASAADALAVTAALAPPSGLTAVGLDRQVHLTWQAVAGNVQGYDIYRSQSAITAGMTGPSTAPGISRVGQVGATQLSFDDVNLTNNSTFYYVVTSVSGSGAESDFGKGSTPTTGVVGIPHTTPASMTFVTDTANLSGNGQSKAKLTVTVLDASSQPTAGVLVNITADNGKFTDLPTNSTTLDTNARQLRALTNLSGQVVVNLQSAVVTAAGAQVSVNLQATAPELPAAVRTVSRTVTFLASRPVVISLTPTSSQLTADGASTTNVAATVLDALGQAVPDGQFTVDFTLAGTNGSIRAAGDIGSNPFVEGPKTISAVATSGGQAVAVYRAGTNSSSTGAPPPNLITLSAAVTGAIPAVTAQTLVTLVPGTAARVDFGQSQLNMTHGTSQTLNVVVRDAQGNAVSQGVVVTFTAQPTGPLTIPSNGTTDSSGTIALQITAGANVGGAVIVGSVAGTAAQSQLAVVIQ